MTLNPLYSTNLQKLLLMAIFCNLYPTNVSAGIIGPHQYDEEVSIIPLRDDCSTLEPIQKYSVKNGETEGVLYTTVCFDGYSLPNALVDEFKYTFIDTGGTSLERCYGIVGVSTPSAIQHKWEFLGAVPGYSCSKTKQTIFRYYPKGY